MDANEQHLTTAAWVMWTYRIQQLEERGDKQDARINAALYLLLANLVGILVSLIHSVWLGK